jgi:hypothetical protein
MSIKNARAKGKGYELQIIKLFKSLGWEGCVSSRSESRLTDAMGVDICYLTPFHVQCKAVENLGSAHNVLARMPKKEGFFNLVFHKKNRAGTFVSMTEEDFVILLKMLIESNQIKPQCTQP